ncbi:MAG: protein kinase [Anaerolineae bacterium]|nr:protein kinase [Anaerolineae bacterium]
MTHLLQRTLSGRYYLREHIGTGGMADVYVAWDTTRLASIAIKVLRRELAADPRFTTQFSKEAKLLKALNHPSIVRLYEFVQDGDIFFIVMDLVEGDNLRNVILKRRTVLPYNEISRILHPISSALYYAHQHKVYHCDIKPANILLHKDGSQVLLTDFGVARIATDRSGGGTPSYMAPEQFSSNNSVDARTDVYALGITLYEILSGGSLPFRGDSSSSQGRTSRERVAWEHQNLPLPNLTLFNKNVPEALVHVISTALAKDPAARYNSPADLRDAFERALTSQDRGRPTGPSTILHTHPPPLPTPQPTPRQLPRVKGPYLLGRSGDWAGKVVPITPQGLTIGRHSQNLVRLHNQSVSRMHAAVQRRGRNIFIADRNSGFGTLVNNQRITQPVRLRTGDIIQIGYSDVFEFREK